MNRNHHSDDVGVIKMKPRAYGVDFGDTIRMCVCVYLSRHPANHCLDTSFSFHRMNAYVMCQLGRRRINIIAINLKIRMHGTTFSHFTLLGEGCNMFLLYIFWCVYVCFLGVVTIIRFNLSTRCISKGNCFAYFCCCLYIGWPHVLWRFQSSLGITPRVNSDYSHWIWYGHREHRVKLTLLNLCLRMFVDFSKSVLFIENNLHITFTRHSQWIFSGYLNKPSIQRKPYQTKQKRKKNR